MIDNTDTKRLRELSKAFCVDVDEHSGKLKVFVDKSWIEEKLIPRHLDENIKDMVDRLLDGKVHDPDREEIDEPDDCRISIDRSLW